MILNDVRKVFLFPLEVLKRFKTFFKDLKRLRKVSLRHGFAYFVGRDRALRPALVFRAARVPQQWRKDFDIDRLLRVLIFCMEVLLRFMVVPGRVETSCLIVDLQDISVKDLRRILTCQLPAHQKEVNCSEEHGKKSSENNAPIGRKQALMSFWFP